VSSDDPFTLPGEDRTVVRPAPGGRRPSVTSAAQVASAALSIEDLGRLSALNPLLGAANPLIALAIQLRSSPQVADLGGLRETLARSVREFESTARGNGVRAEVVLAARYCLCTFLDEVIATTPWGSGGAWANNSLLVTFHNEGWGGEKFYALLKRVTEDPANNVDLLELMYICISFGFQGKYRVVEGGRSQLEELRERLYLTIRSQRGEPESDLSPHWKGAAHKRMALTNWLPVWVGAALAGVCLLLAYLGFGWSLSRSSDPVHAALHDIPGKFAPAPPKPSSPVPPTQLPVLLQPEIAAGWVSVSEFPDRTVVRIKGDKLFESGSATVNAQYQPVLQKVAEALNSAPGAAVVSGHTDDRRMLSARFPSNWDLSKARAEAVVRLLSSGLTNSSRLRVEARADTEPVAPNDTPEHRALNRRVDITVFPATLAPGQAVRR